MNAMRGILATLAVATLLPMACNWDEGACWSRTEDDGEGAGAGGPVVPSGAGGFGDAPPDSEDDSDSSECGEQGKWSDLPECDLQYEQDTADCNRYHKKADAAKCRGVQSERLAYCNKTGGETGKPPRWKGGKND